MNLQTALEKKPYWGLIVSLLFGATILFTGLGSFGIWEPQELNLAELAEKIKEGETAVSPGLHIEERLSAWSWSVLGQTELSTRLPLAIMALLTAIGLFFLFRPLTGPVPACLALLVMVASPIFLFHGRQLTGGMPIIFGEVLGMGGLAAAYWVKRPLVKTVSLALGLIGIAIGWLSSNLLVGLVVPLATVSAAGLMVRGRWPSFKKSSDFSRWQEGLLVALSIASILGLAAYFSIIFFASEDVPLVTGGLVQKPNYTLAFDFALGQLAYGWFPWSAFAPLCVVGFFRTDKDEENPMLFARAVAVGGLLIGFLAHVISIDLSGLAPCLVAAPMALTAAIAINDIAHNKEHMRLFGLIGIAMLVLMVRDFILEPAKILSGYGYDKIAIPEKDYKPIIKAAIFALPAGLLMISSFLTDTKWRKWQIRILAPMAPLTFGAFVSFSLVPDISVHLSSKHAVEAYERFRKGDEPLGVYGPSRFFTNAEKLRTIDDVVKWLQRDDRVFALFPPKNLSEADRKIRDKTGSNIFVLDAESDKFLVATSKPLPGEKNDNPLSSYAQSKPYSPAPSHPLNVNFDDKLTLLGWDVKSPKGKDRLTKGKDFVFTSYWHVKQPVRTNYKIFMHIDGPGGRMHGDHYPFEGKFPTNQWAKGDYIKEEFTMKAPLYQQSGSYKISMGMYQEAGGSRLKIKDEPKASQNSLVLSHVMLD